MWIIDDYMQWSNLAYLAVSRVENMDQLTRVVPAPMAQSEGDRAPPPPPAQTQLTEHQLRRVIAKMLVGYKRQDEANGREFDLKVKDVLALRARASAGTAGQQTRCAACNIELLWSYEPKDTQQWSLDRVDNTRGHLKTTSG